MTEAGNWVDVGSVGDIPVRGARVARTEFGDIAIFKAGDGALFALLDRCPHKGGPLSQGIVHGRAVTCPLHNWVIELETGEARAPDQGCVKTIPLKIESGRILIRADALSGATAA
ncbi:MAG: nitrite reductase small subunit NirD [Alphaproteobacteria bacterium]